MKPYVRIALIALSLVAFVASGCGGMAPLAVQEPVAQPRTYDLEAEFRPSPTASPAATPPVLPHGDAFGPSTGGTDEPNDQPYGDVFFDNYGVNPRIDTEDDNLSTFAVAVDTASYTVMRRAVNAGYLPNSDSVRVEEYVNFFDPGYAPPTEDAFAIHIDGAPSPYVANYHLVRVGVQGYEVPAGERPDVVLTFVIDVSGSMEMENRPETGEGEPRVVGGTTAPHG